MAVGRRQGRTPMAVRSGDRDVCIIVTGTLLVLTRNFPGIPGSTARIWPYDTIPYAGKAPVDYPAV